MLICPKCKNEYRPGIKYCADCGCELIEVETDADDQRELLFTGAYPVCRELMKFLAYCKIDSAQLSDPDEEGNCRITCESRDKAEGAKQVKVFLQQQIIQDTRQQVEELSHLPQEELEKLKEETAARTSDYVRSADKAEENRSAATAFLFVGILGVVLTVLSFVGLLPFSFGGQGNLFTHGILLAVFLAMIVIGINSARSVSGYEAAAQAENDLEQEVRDYAKEHFTREDLERIAADAGEEGYFQRMSYMRRQVNEHFAPKDLPPSMVESVLDEVYDGLFS
ncbi:MAG: hypothetical protein LUH19_03920 [Lachnospiraceae bacterium]|nr:hypothetical protein [Lachnospiraceae bacterium]